MAAANNLARPYITTIVILVAAFYFLGGHSLPTWTWALLTVMVPWIMIKGLLRDTGLESEESYERWRQGAGLILIVFLLITSLWQDSWWVFFVGLVLGAVWLDDVRPWQGKRTHENVNAEVKDHGRSSQDYGQNPKGGCVWKHPKNLPQNGSAMEWAGGPSCILILLWAVCL